MNKPLLVSPKLARLAIASEQTPSLANVWQKNGTYLLLVGEINLAYPTAQAAALAIISKLDELWSQQATAIDTTEEILEKILLELNKTLWQIFSPYPHNPTVPRYHLALAITRDTEIGVSVLGNASAFVVSTEKFTNIIKVALSADHDTTLNRKPIFQQLVSGNLKIQEALILINPSILDYFSVAQLRNIVGQSSPGQCVNEIKKTLTVLDTQPAVSLIIYKLEPTLSSANDEILLFDKKPGPQTVATGWITKLGNMFKKTTIEVTAVRSATILSPSPTTKNRLTKIIQCLIKFIKNIPWRRHDIKERLTLFLGRSWAKYQRLPNSQKTMATLTVVLIFILSLSILSSNKQNFVSSQQKNYQNKLSEIKEIISQTETAIIYHDDNKATYLLQKVNNELQKLSTNTKQEKNNYTQLLDIYQQLEQKITRQITITEPKLVIDLTKLSTETWRGLLISKNLLAYNQKGWLVEINKQQANKLLTIPVIVGAPTNILALTNNRLLVTTENNNAWLINLNNKSSLQLTRQLPSTLDLASYTESRLYLLTKKPLNIQRSNVSDKDFTSPVDWLKNAQKLANNTISLTIDGSIYTLTTTGEVIKYTKGLQQTFTLNTALNLIGNTKIRTSAESDYLYLLNPEQKKITLLTKEGKLAGQFMFPNIHQLTDLVSDGKNKLLYLLGDNKIWQIDLVNYLK